MICGASLFFSSFDLEKFYPILVEFYIQYRTSGIYDLVAEDNFTEEEIKRIEKETTKKGNCNFELIKELLDQKGHVVAVTKGRY